MIADDEHKSGFVILWRCWWAVVARVSTVSFYCGVP